ncbi:MAG: hypothetical protein H7061_03730 [Bdellovibrionaceae bacterium]|nr:hypothetical protein [Bdellovibrio sp.]
MNIKLFFLILSTCFASHAVTPASPQRSGPQYMGFFASAMNGVGRGDYINEVQPYSNYVYVRDLTPELMIAKVKKAKALGMKSIIAVQNVFFPWHNSNLSPRWQYDFEILQKTLQPEIDSILGFYLYDEPYWTNREKGWVSVPDTQLFQSLEFAASTLKKSYPTKPIALTFAYPELKSGLLIPKSIDWIGFNCYAAYGDVCSENQVTGYFNFLLRNKYSAQKLILTIDAYWNRTPTQAIESKIVERLEHWKKLITANSNEVAALMPFVYQTHAPENLYGAESFPRVRQWLQNYAKELKIKP